MASRAHSYDRALRSAGGGPKPRLSGSQKGIAMELYRGTYGCIGLYKSIWVVVRIMVPFWIPIIIRHLIFRDPKRDHNVDNHPYRVPREEGGKRWKLQC